VKLRYTRPARLELELILEHPSVHSPQGAAKVHARIRAVTELLLRHPHIGVATDDPVIRRATLNPYPYVIFYEPSGDEMVVHSIRHGARNSGGG